MLWDGAQTLRVNGLYRHGYMIVPEVADEAVRFAAALLDGRIGDADAFADWQQRRALERAVSTGFHAGAGMSVVRLPVN